MVLFLQARARNLSEFVLPMHSGVVVGFECCILFLKLLELLGVRDGVGFSLSRAYFIINMHVPKLHSKGDD